jgi:hypothetical protein
MKGGSTVVIRADPVSQGGFKPTLYMPKAEISINNHVRDRLYRNFPHKTAETITIGTCSVDEQLLSLPLATTDIFFGPFDLGVGLNEEEEEEEEGDVTHKRQNTTCGWLLSETAHMLNAKGSTGKEEKEERIHQIREQTLKSRLWPCMLDMNKIVDAKFTTMHIVHVWAENVQSGLKLRER